MTVRATSQDILCDWSACLCDIHSKPLSIVCFSMLLHFFQCPYPIWNILSHLRFALSINTTKELFQIAMQIPYPIWMNILDHLCITVIGADNWLVYMRLFQQRIKDEVVLLYSIFLQLYVLIYLKNFFYINLILYKTCFETYNIYHSTHDQYVPKV